VLCDSGEGLPETPNYGRCLVFLAPPCGRCGEVQVVVVVAALIMNGDEDDDEFKVSAVTH